MFGENRMRDFGGCTYSTRFLMGKVRHTGPSEESADRIGLVCFECRCLFYNMIIFAALLLYLLLRFAGGVLVRGLTSILESSDN